MGLTRFGDMSVSCVLRDLSEVGAALDVGPQSGIPDQFTLIVVPKKKIYSCNVMWRIGRRIGVVFRQGVARTNEAPPNGGEMKTCVARWRQIARIGTTECSKPSPKDWQP
jgi:hypothetical protein